MNCNDVCVYTIVPLIISIGLWKTTIGRTQFVGFTQNLVNCNDVCVYTIVPLMISIGLWKTTIGNDQNIIVLYAVLQM